MYSCSLVRMPPLNRQTSMLPSGIFSTSRTLASTATGQKTMSNSGGHVEDLLVDRQHGDLAAAAGGGPVRGPVCLWLRFAHGWTSIASACSRDDLFQGLGALAVFLPVGRPVERPQLPHVGHEAVDRLGQVLPFGRRGPDQPQPVGLDPHLLQEVAGAWRGGGWSCSSARCSGSRRGGSRRSSRRRPPGRTP